jgi:hypothetical protein
MIDDDDTDDKSDGVRWVKKDAFVMPVLPKSLQVDPVVASLLHLAAFLELSGDDSVDPDWAVEAMEHVGHYLQQLPTDRVGPLRQQIDRVAEYGRKKKWSQETVNYFDEFLENFGIGEEEGD